MLSFEIPRNKTRLLYRRITPQMFEELCNKTSWITNKSLTTLRERVFCLENNLLFPPKCPECGNNTKWLFGKGEYATYCSTKCMTNSNKVKDKFIETNLLKYGVKFPAQCKEIYDKLKLNNLVKYGVEFPQQTKEVQDKLSISHANNYQSRKTIKDYKGVVYILHFPEHNAVKIGISGDFSKRSNRLIRDFGEFTVVKLIETDTCFKLEKELHEKFKTQRICLSEGTGRTEFFTEEILSSFK